MRNTKITLLLSVLMLAGVLLLIMPVHSAGLITITTTSDLISSDGLCSLREAIIAANTDSAFHDCPAGSGDDTVDFAHSLVRPATFTLSLSGANEDNALTGDLDIIGNLTIAGSGSNEIIVDGLGSDRVFDIRPGAHVTISGVTIRNGKPPGSLEGGGIRVQGSLSLTNSTVSNNAAGGVFNNGGGMVLTEVKIINNTGGYGVQNLNQAVLTFNGGQVTGNQGGGISNATSTATLSNIFVTGNTGGGGVRNSGATLSHLTLSSSTISGNSATNGGGVFNDGVGATAGIINSAITGNTASAAGGGVYNNGIMTISNCTLYGNHARSGGGVDHAGGNLSLTNDTISSNSASDNGGGLYTRSSAVLASLTLTGNSANGPGTGGNIFNDTAQLSIRNSIIANSDSDGNCYNSDGVLNSLGYNLDSANTCEFTTTGDIINTDPLLGPIQDNLGPTKTHALLADSPAIDAANPATPGSGGNACPAIDQRAVPRPEDGDGNGSAICDIGAFEYQLNFVPPTPPAYASYLPFVSRN